MGYQAGLQAAVGFGVSEDAVLGMPQPSLTSLCSTHVAAVSNVRTLL